MWPLKLNILEKQPCSEWNTHLWDFSGREMGNPFVSKTRHVTPQIDRHKKSSPVLRVITHIYGISQEIDGKSFIWWINLGMWPLKSFLGKSSPVLKVSTHIYGISKERDGKTFISSNLDACDPSNRSSQKNKPCSEGFNTHLWDF